MDGAVPASSSTLASSNDMVPFSSTPSKTAETIQSSPVVEAMLAELGRQRMAGADHEFLDGMECAISVAQQAPQSSPVVEEMLAALGRQRMAGAYHEFLDGMECAISVANVQGERISLVPPPDTKRVLDMMLQLTRHVVLDDVRRRLSSNTDAQ